MESEPEYGKRTSLLDSFVLPLLYISHGNEETFCCFQVRLTRIVDLLCRSYRCTIIHKKGLSLPNRK